MSHRDLVENFYVALNKSMNEALRACSIGLKFHADTTIDGITPCFSGGVPLVDGDGPTNGANVIDHLADHEVIELYLLFYFWPSW